MSSYRRKLSRGERWFYKFDFMGKTYRSKAIYQTKAEAKKAEAEKYHQVEARSVNPQKEITLFEALNERLDSLQQRKSKKYYKENLRYFQMAIKYFGAEKRISEITKHEANRFVSDFANALKKRGKTLHKANALIRCLKAVLNYVINLYDLEAKNPFKLPLYPVDRELKHIPSNEEIEAVLTLCDEEEALLVAFVMETGARINEVLRITPADFRDGYLILRTRKSKNSNLVSRKVPVPESSRCLDFTGNAGEMRIFNRWSDQPRFLEKMVKKLGFVQWGFHNLRHRYASRLSRANTPLFEIMSLLGHSQISTTQGYLQLLP